MTEPRSGWIRLHRKVRDHWFWPQRHRYSHFEAWIDLLLSANHRQGKVPIGSKLITVERGQVLTSQLSLARRWRWNRKTVNAFLKITKGDQILDFESSKEVHTGFTLITIRNYSKYQGKENEALDIEADNGTDTRGTTEGQPRDTNNKNKEELKKNYNGFPKDFTITDQLRALAKKKEWLNPDTELEGFRDFHVAKGSKFKDWEAALRTWLRNGKAFGRKPEVDPWDAYKDE